MRWGSEGGGSDRLYKGVYLQDVAMFLLTYFKLREPTLKQVKVLLFSHVSSLTVLKPDTAREVARLACQSLGIWYSELGAVLGWCS